MTIVFYTIAEISEFYLNSKWVVQIVVMKRGKLKIVPDDARTESEALGTTSAGGKSASTPVRDF